MKPKKNSIASILRTLPENIFSGFVVSLIALPLGLGLAMASDAPPIAGIIAAVVGGIMVSILGGSHVTIAGPGNGLVGVLLVAISTLGLETAYVAIVVSGGLLLVLGFLRMGKIANFFPSSAIAGMLAAIGLIILGKQFHIMLGNRLSLPGSIDYLLAIPKTLIGLFSYVDRGIIFAAIAGISSLLIMVFYARLRSKIVQLIPAPMWIVLLWVGVSYFFELVMKQPSPIAADYMLSGIPEPAKIIEDIPTLQFTGLSSTAFWMNVIALTLVASIESLLSIKAVDKLDPQKRRANVNRDLKALGVATVASGFLGGLNVVTVIARSSVNVNNGGSNRLSNFFHALFLVIFIALFSTQLERIPLPALMAILVYTGYKLASPESVKRIFNVGREQLVIFFVTLIVTLIVDLITGILAGVFITFVIHLFVTKNPGLFFRNLLKPNVLMFKEEAEEGNFFISVKHFCTFLNFYKLKQKLDAIPEDQDVILDFSMCEFVDHTVMESINDYQDLFDKRGGHFEVIGLELHDTDSKHPFALRKLLPIPQIMQQNFTRRQRTLEELAKDYHISYTPGENHDCAFLRDFLFFKTKSIDYIYNSLTGEDASFKMFDVHYSEGEFIAKEVIRASMLHLRLSREIPIFSLDRETLLQRVYSLAGFTDINLDNHPDFSKRFYLRGEDHEAIRAFFTDELVHFFESNPYYHIESNGTSLLVFSKTRLASIKELKALLDFGKRLSQVAVSQ
ncbi:MAG: SulP family inorganic anion transporter [Gilvibacter sp.]